MTTVDTVTRIARGEVGYHEGRSNGHWDNHEKYAPAVPTLTWAQNQAWCATFVSWVALTAGCAELYPCTASCDVAGAWFKAKHRWSEYPAVGAQIFYGTASNLQHTGIVVGYDATTVTTVEGNTNTNGSAEGDGVYLKVHQRTDPWVVGYGYPLFAEGIDSADPAYRTTPKPPAPKPAPKPVTHPGADKLAADAAKLAAHTHGARSKMFARVARLVRPFTTHK